MKKALFILASLAIISCSPKNHPLATPPAVVDPPKDETLDPFALNPDCKPSSANDTFVITRDDRGNSEDLMAKLAMLPAIKVDEKGEFKRYRFVLTKDLRLIIGSNSNMKPEFKSMSEGCEITSLGSFRFDIENGLIQTLRMKTRRTEEGTSVASMAEFILFLAPAFSDSVTLKIKKSKKKKDKKNEDEVEPNQKEIVTIGDTQIIK
jgi:hypothetical protein